MKAGRNVIGEHLLIHEVPIWYFEFFCEQTSVSINFCSSRESGLKKNPLKVKSSSTELDFSLIWSNANVICVRMILVQTEQGIVSMVGLQMGTNKGASQSGMTFGKHRMINDWSRRVLFTRNSKGSTVLMEESIWSDSNLYVLPEMKSTNCNRWESKKLPKLCQFSPMLLFVHIPQQLFKPKRFHLQQGRTCNRFAKKRWYVSDLKNLSGSTWGPTLQSNRIPFYLKLFTICLLPHRCWLLCDNGCTVYGELVLKCWAFMMYEKQSKFLITNKSHKVWWSQRLWCKSVTLFPKHSFYSRKFFRAFHWTRSAERLHPFWDARVEL